MRRIQSEGEFDIIPAGLDSEWEDDASCTILRMYIAKHLVYEAADAMGYEGSGVDLVPQFQLRDRRIEYIGRTLKEELSADIPSSPLFAEMLAKSLAIRIVHNTKWGLREINKKRQTLSSRQISIINEYIEKNIDGSLTLINIAKTVGISVSHLSTLFRQTTGLSLHQYVIRQRVKRAKKLLLSSQMSVSEVALDAGFANQSHLSRSMRRVLGISPGTIARSMR